MNVRTLLLFAFVAVCLAACQARQPNDPVVTAVAENDIGAVQQYFDDGGDPNLKNRDGRPLLFIASGPKGGAEVAALLLKFGANPNTPADDGRTPLHNAAAWCDVEMVQLLIGSGANLDQPNADGERPLDVVCKSPEDRRSLINGLLIEAAAQEGK